MTASIATVALVVRDYDEALAWYTRCLGFALVAARLVSRDDEIMLITDKGVLVRTRVSEIREMGRATQGVTLIGLDEGSQLSGLQRIVENDANQSDSSEDGIDNAVDNSADDSADAPDSSDPSDRSET